ncbi:MAG: sugar porter family MFS transporter [Chitinophagaceae bacterium]
MKQKSFSSRQQFICITVAVGGLLFGFDTAVISGAIHLIKDQYALDTSMEGWLVSSGLAGCIIGVMCTGLLSDRIGRKKTILIAGFMFLISAIGCAFPGSVTMLIVARMIGGIGVGMASVISPMLIAEFAPPEKRGRMIAYYQLAITLGLLLAFFSNLLITNYSTHEFSSETANWFFKQESWRPMFLAMAIPSIIFLFLLAGVPESPRWLVSVGKEEKAKKILYSIRPALVAERELSDINKAAFKASQNNRSVFSPAIRLPLLIGIVLAVLQQFSGINAVMYYGPSIFQTAGAENSNAILYQVIIGAINLLFTIVAIKLADKLGRKFLLKTGLTGIVISLTLSGFLFYTGQTQGPLLLILILVYIACFAFSLGPVTWIIINEIFPTDVRVRAVSICTLALWAANWMVAHFFPRLLDNLGAAGIFWAFAACSLVNFLFSWNIVKETSGKTLEEMENVFAVPH